MIISHKHKFIFIKPHKTAGTSVELLLSRICGPDDVITPLGFDPDPNVREKHQAKAPQNYYRPKPFKHWQMNELFWFVTKGRKPNLNYWEHLRADKIREYIGDEIWNSYLKISIVRNPWDHAISQYDWMRRYKFGGVKDDFKDFLKFRYKDQWPFYSCYGEYDIDFMIEFENLSKGIASISEALGVALGDLPITKSGIRINTEYRERFGENEKELVRFRNLQLLERFPYSFK